LIEGVPTDKATLREAFLQQPSPAKKGLSDKEFNKIIKNIKDPFALGRGKSTLALAIAKEAVKRGK
jgi:DNA replication protein DnaC